VTIVFLAIGLPIALLLSWAYEVTPEGVKKTEEVDKSKSITHGTGRRINKLIIGGLVLAVGFLLYDKFMLTPDQPSIEQARAAATSIAVLPFVNMSADKSNEYFSDGITEELLNTLVRVPGLNVSARTSSFSYKGLNRDVREIGKELGVETIVEGSVRRDGDDLRITAQLIRVSDGFHMWSEIYDRKYENIFAIQEEIAFSIAEAVQAPLGLESGSLVSSRMTNMAAYDQYLQARRLIRERGEGLGEAVLILREVVAAEPDFAPAWAAMAIALSTLTGYFSEFDGKPIIPKKINNEAELAAIKAVSLDPDLADARHALANALRNRGAFAAAEDHYKVAYALDPSSIEILEDFAELYGAVFYFERALELAEEAVALEPGSPLALAFYGDDLARNGRVKEAIAAHLKALEIQPTFSWSGSALLEHYLTVGEPEKALAHLEANDGYWETYLTENFQPQMDFAPLRARVKGEDWVVPKGWQGAHWYPFYAYYLAGEDLFLDAQEYFAFETGDTLFGYNFEGMARIRTNERFKALVLAAGLVDYWRERGWPKVCWPVGDFDFECGAARE